MFEFLKNSRFIHYIQLKNRGLFRQKIKVFFLKKIKVFFLPIDPYKGLILLQGSIGRSGNDVSYVTRINHEMHFAWQAQFLVRFEVDFACSAHSK